MRKWLYILAAALLLPALLLNLGVMVFIDDEAIRALVAQEMLWSGNFLVPAMHGDAYLNKPPLWNWVLALSFVVHGGAGEWAARLPTVLALLGFAATVYGFSRRYFPRYLAVVHALTVVTCGRMLFWDSMLALIDVTFSWVVYLQIVLLYHFGHRGQWWRAFGWAYLLTAVGFLLKGLPAFVFQGLSVLAIVGWCRAWSQLWRPAHLVSGLGCLLLLAPYYYLYAEYVDLGRVASQLFVESGKRTAVAHGAGETLRHLLSFPFEMAYHFLPWTLLLAYLFQRGSWARLRRNDFAAFCLVVFLVNLPVYWVSPNVYPRYLLMLFPLLFGSLLWLHHGHAQERTATHTGLRYLLLTTISVAAVGLPFIPWIPGAEAIGGGWFWSLGLGAVAGAVAVVGWRSRPNLLLAVACSLLVVRLAFNVFLLPARAAGDERGQAVRATATAVAERYADRRLAIYRHSLIEPATGYYLTVARGGVIRREYNYYLPTTVYVGDPEQYPELRIEAGDSLYLRHRDRNYPVGPLGEIPPPARPDGELLDGMGSGIPLDPR